MSNRKATAGERVELMLSILPWLAARGSAPLSELAELFGADPDALLADLTTVPTEVMPRGAPDEMVEVHISDDDDPWVDVRLPGYFEQPPLLDHTEALRLLVAGTALVGEPGSDVALAPALEKLAAALGPATEAALQVDLGRGDPVVRRLMRDALDQRRRLEIDYFAWGTAEVSHRTVDPWAVRSIGGNWYLTANCHSSGGVRHFRLDRVLAAEATGASDAYELPAEVPEPTSGIGEGGRLVRVVVPSDAAWMLQPHPHEEWSDDGEVVSVTLRIHNDVWLERLLLRLGPDSTARDLATDESLVAERAAAARRILARYGVSGDKPADR